MDLDQTSTPILIGNRGQCGVGKNGYDEKYPRCKLSNMAECRTRKRIVCQIPSGILDTGNRLLLGGLQMQMRRLYVIDDQPPLLCTP